MIRFNEIMINDPNHVKLIEHPIRKLHHVALLEKDRQGNHNGSHFNMIIEMNDPDRTHINFSCVLWDHMGSYFMTHLYMICVDGINMDQFMKELRSDLLEIIDSY